MYFFGRTVFYEVFEKLTNFGSSAFAFGYSVTGRTDK
jgi:hypothetical protein